MCGRFTLTTAAEIVADVFGAAPSVDLAPRYNIAPTQDVAIVRVVRERAGRSLDGVRWGLVPFWAKDPAIGNRMINARAETVAEKPAYRAAFRRRRCLVPADGFYEWRKTGKTKHPCWIHRADRAPFALAGLWEHWKRGNEAIESCTILTTTANELMKPIHDRMPVILAPDAYERWLDTTNEDVDGLRALLAPYAADDLKATAVGTYVNNPRNDDPRCLEPA